MKKKAYLEIFKDIQKNKDYTRLETLTDACLQGTLTKQEQTLFTDLLLKLGKYQMPLDQQKAHHTFNLALSQSPNYAKTLLSQGKLWFKYGLDKLDIACFDRSRSLLNSFVQKSPQNIEGRIALSQTLLQLGVLREDITHFQEVDDLCKELLEKQDKEYSEYQLSLLYLEWGQAWSYLGDDSGEAMDVYKALTYLEKSFMLGCEEEKLLLNFAHCHKKMSFLIGKPEHLKEAKDLYRMLIKRNPRDFNILMLLGDIYYTLYELEGKESYYQEGLKVLEQAMDVDNTALEVNEKLARIKLFSARYTHDTIRLKEACELLETVVEQNSSRIENVSLLIQSYICLGALTERYDYFQEAENKLLEVVEKFSESALIWNCFGELYLEKADYFIEEDYLHDAIEKFHKALKVDESFLQAFWGLGKAYMLLTEFTTDSNYAALTVHYLERYEQDASNIGQEFYKDWGIILMKLAEIFNDCSILRKAVEKLNKALEYSEKLEILDLDVYYHYACSLDFLADFEENNVYYEKAIEIFNYILGLDPDFIQARHNLALALAHQAELNLDSDQFNQSLASFEQLIQQSPYDELIWLDWGISLLTFSQVLEETLDDELSDALIHESENKLIQAVTLGNSHAYYYLACLYSVCNKFKQSFESFQQATYLGELPSIEDVEEDPWLDGLKKNVAFQLYWNNYKNK